MTRLAVLIPYFAYGPSAFRDMLLRRLLLQLDHPRIDVFLASVDVDIRAKMQPLGPTHRWEHVNLLPTSGGDVMWQKAFALNYGKRVLYEQRKEYFGLCLLDGDADLDQLAGELVYRCEHMHETSPEAEVIGSPFPVIKHNGRVLETAWSRLARTSLTFDNCPRYSTKAFASNPPGGCIYMSWGISQWYQFCEWLPVGGDDSVFFSQVLGDMQAKAVVDDEHVAQKLRGEPNIADDLLINGLLYNKHLSGTYTLHIKSSPQNKAVLPFADHGSRKAATYVSRHSLTEGHNLLHCVCHERAGNQPVYWDSSAPQELRDSVAEYLKSI